MALAPRSERRGARSTGSARRVHPSTPRGGCNRARADRHRTPCRPRASDTSRPPRRGGWRTHPWSDTPGRSETNTGWPHCQTHCHSPRTRCTVAPAHRRRRPKARLRCHPCTPQETAPPRQRRRSSCPDVIGWARRSASHSRGADPNDVADTYTATSRALSACLLDPDRARHQRVRAQRGGLLEGG
jgi:hypothetical protein